MLDFERWRLDIGTARDKGRHDDSEWQERFLLADLNADGAIDYEEFYTWFAGGHLPY